MNDHTILLWISAVGFSVGLSMSLYLSQQIRQAVSDPSPPNPMGNARLIRYFRKARLKLLFLTAMSAAGLFACFAGG